MTNQYLLDVLENVKKRNPGEPEFIQTVTEVLSTIEWGGATYMAVIPAGDTKDEFELEVSIFKSTDEDGESVLCIIEDENELQTVYDLIMDTLYEEEDEE